MQGPIEGALYDPAEIWQFPWQQLLYVHLHEVDVEVYCGSTKETEGACSVDQSVDMCSNRDLITDSNKRIISLMLTAPDWGNIALDTVSALELFSTADQKSDWTIQYSSLLPQCTNPESVINGVQIASPNSLLFFTNYKDFRPWLQIDMAQSRVVKAVITYA